MAEREILRPPIPETMTTTIRTTTTTTTTSTTWWPSSSNPDDPQTSQSPLLPDLPDEIGVLCIARVPRAHHPHLSLVSKSWLAALRSPHLYSLRSQLNLTQPLLFLTIRTLDPNSPFQSYLLHPSPKPPTPHPLPPLPSSPHPIGAACAALGTNILLIGGSINDVPSSAVHVFDSTANRWGTAPRMRFGREFAAAGVVDGRVYVLGGCVVDNWTKSRHWAEVFDPKVGAWAPVPPSPLDFQEKWMHGSAVLGGRIYAVADRGGVVFDPNEGSWGHVSKRMDLGWRGRAAVVDGVLYCYDYLGKIRGFVEEEEEGECVWKQVRGLDKGLPKFMCGATMANVGGNLCVLWEGKGLANQVEISCALIDICRDSFGELRGSILSSQVILVVPRGSSIVHCLDVAL